MNTHLLTDPSLNPKWLGSQKAGYPLSVCCGNRSSGFLLKLPGCGRQPVCGANTQLCPLLHLFLISFAHQYSLFLLYYFFTGEWSSSDECWNDSHHSWELLSVTCSTLILFSLLPWTPLQKSVVSHFSHVWLCNPLDCSPPGFSTHEIFQARMLEWVAISSSRGSSPPRVWTGIS